MTVCTEIFFILICFFFAYWSSCFYLLDFMLVTISFRLDNGGVIPLKDLVSKLIHIGLMCVILFPKKNEGISRITSIANIFSEERVHQIPVLERWSLVYIAQHIT